MPSLMEALKGMFAGSEDILFLNDVLGYCRQVRKVYHYDYTEDDKAALQACATDLRPFTFSFLPAAAVYGGLGKIVRNPKQLGGMARSGLVLVQLAAALEVFRLGYLVGSYKQGIDCTRRLVSLRTALGGEVVAIIRDRDPRHPLLRFERPPTELNEDGTRPRIVSEDNRLARIAHLRRGLAQAKQGQTVDRGNELADERLYRIMRHREEMVGEIQRGGGPVAAASTGKLESMQPQQQTSYTAEYEAAAGGPAVTGTDRLAAVAHNGGLVISDQPTSQQAAAAHKAVQEALLAAVADATGRASEVAGTSNSGCSVAASSASSSEDPLGMLLGGGGDVLWEGEQQGEAQSRAAEEERQHRRRHRRARWWHRHSGRGKEESS